MAPKQTRMPVKGGMRRRRTSAPQIRDAGSDSTIIKYSAIGNVVNSGTGTTLFDRVYAPGFAGPLANNIGPYTVGAYSTAKFLPGTTARWEPSVSFTTSGRVFVAFTDNPEVAHNYFTGYTPAQKVTALKGMSNMRSFPVWQETDVHIPLTLRRKRFDTNANIATEVNVFDRSCQTFMLCAVEGAPSSTDLGSFWFHDVVSVEGLHPTLT